MPRGTDCRKSSKRLRFEIEVHTDRALQALLNLPEPVSVGRLLQSREYILWKSWSVVECRRV